MNEEPGRPPPPRPDLVAGLRPPPPIPSRQGALPLSLEPMRVGEMLDATIKLYRLQWKLFMGIAAYILVPYLFLQSFLTRTTSNPFSFEAEPEVDTTRIILVLVFALGTYLFIQPFLTAAFARAASDIYLGGNPSIKSIYRFALPRTHSILWVSFLYALVTGIGFLLLIVPGFLFFVRFAFGSVVVVLEGTKGTKALRRSWRLSKKHFWKIIGTLFLAGLLTSVVGGILQLPLTAVGAALGSAGWILAGVGAALAGIVTRPFAAVIGVLLYFDLRIRKEGLDLAIMAQELSASRP